MRDGGFSRPLLPYNLISSYGGQRKTEDSKDRRLYHRTGHNRLDGEPADPIEVIIFGESYLIEVETHVVETHVLDNITYVMLDSPVFRAQTKAYPARMDDLSSAIFYSNLESGH
jgi:hypothetical protein